MKKQFATLGLTTAIAAFALVGTNTAAVGAQAATPAATAAASGLKVGLVTDVGRVTDRGFNQSSWEGVKASADALGIPSEYIETTDPADYATNINTLIDKGDNVIVTVGFNLADATVKAAAGNPKVWFIGVDEAQDPILPNVVGIVFNEDQSGFLAGVLATRMSKSGTIAGVYGASVPAVVRFKSGFENGAKYANPKITVQSTYYPGNIANAFNDPTWGASTAGQAIDQGADVVFAAGGGTGNGALAEVARRTTAAKPLYCIGVDTDQWLTLEATTHTCLLSSAVKNIPPAIDLVLKQAVAGTIKGGNFTGTVALAPFHDFSTVIPQKVQDELTQLAADLASGKLSTGYSAAPAATAAATMAATASK